MLSAAGCSLAPGGVARPRGLWENRSGWLCASSGDRLRPRSGLPCEECRDVVSRRSVLVSPGTSKLAWHLTTGRAV